MKNLIYLTLLLISNSIIAQKQTQIVQPVGIALNENKDGILLKLRNEDWDEVDHLFKIKNSLKIKGEEFVTCQKSGDKCILTIDQEILLSSIHDDLAMSSGRMSEAIITFEVIDNDTILLSLEPNKYFPKQLIIDVFNNTKENKVLFYIMDLQGLVIKKLTLPDSSMVRYLYKKPETLKVSTKKIDINGLVMIVEYENDSYQFLIHKDNTLKLESFKLKGKKLIQSKDEEIILESLPEDLKIEMAKNQLLHPEEN